MKHSLHLLIALLCLLLVPKNGVSCSCTGKATFCLAASANNFVLEVEVKKKYRTMDPYKDFIDFKINKEIFNTSHESYDFLTFVEHGTSCDIFLSSQVKIGDKLIITFKDTSELKEANYTVFEFPYCTESHLKLSNGIVSGIINDYKKGEVNMSYAKFRRNVDEICNIDFLHPSIVNIKSNVTEGNLHIKSNFEEGLEFDIIDASGKLAFNGSIMAGEEKELVLSDYPAGLYFIRFRNGQSQMVKKVVKS